MDCHSLAAELRAPAGKMAGLAAIKTRWRPYICPLDMVLAEIRENARVYDIGCGSGALLYLALKLRGASVAHGYDVAADAVEASRAFDAAAPAFAVSHLPPEATPPVLAGYDTVTMVDVLHHLPPSRQDGFVQQVLANMDPGARLIVKDIEAAKRLGACCNRLHDLVLARQWVHHRRSVDIARLLETEGATIEKTAFRWQLWYPHYQIVAMKTP